MENIQELTNTYIAKTYNRAPLQLIRGEGSLVYDTAGKRYIDLGTGIAVNQFGIADSAWVQAVTAQLSCLQHTSNIYYSAPGAMLAQMLCQRTGLERVFFSNSGAEANECAIKTARRRAFQTYGDESHSTIITLQSSFHGRTITTLSATGQDCFHTEFGPFTGGFVHSRPGDIADLYRLADSSGCCAVMLETIQGEGGINVLDREYVRAAWELCQKRDMLLIVDEVQTGNGRTGKLYSYMHYDITPDIVTTAKGLAGGLPMGATLFGSRCADVLTPGSHGSTFGGNPVAAAGAVSIIERIDDALLADVLRKEQLIRTALADASGIIGVSGRGLMLGIQCEKKAGEIMSRAAEEGVLVLTAKDKVRLLPALNIPDDLLLEAMEILKRVIAE